jgi:hypothetical protein
MQTTGSQWPSGWQLRVGQAWNLLAAARPHTVTMPANSFIMLLATKGSAPCRSPRILPCCDCTPIYSILQASRLQRCPWIQLHHAVGHQRGEAHVLDYAAC